jgi:Protein of unknown function (DUF2891)
MFASLALSHVGREYPNKLDHVINGAGDLASPRGLHPLFFGSFDWHSCVHGYWLLARLYRLFDALPERPRIRELFDIQITEGHVAGEVAYLHQPNRSTFERPYGWGWLLMFAAELERLDDRRWASTVRPLANEFVRRFYGFLQNATYPIRSGAHSNTAFAFVLAFDYAQTVNDAALAAVLRKRAEAWYGNDVDCQAWEPSGDDFLSPALIEAECMRRTLTPERFGSWFAQFLPRIASRQPVPLFIPAVVSDRADGKIAHLDGLNLSRAWCWRSLAAAFPPGDARREIAKEAAAVHLEAGLPHVSGDYMGEHWLATFAVLALNQLPPD